MPRRAASDSSLSSLGESSSSTNPPRPVSPVRKKRKTSNKKQQSLAAVEADQNGVKRSKYTIFEHILNNTPLTPPSSPSPSPSRRLASPSPTPPPFDSEFQALLDSCRDLQQEYKAPFRATTLPAGVDVGSILLACVQRNYWPARLIIYTPALAQGEKEKFLVNVKGFGERWLGRNRVTYLNEGEKLLSCTLGKTQLVVNRAAEAWSDAATRDATPPPQEDDSAELALTPSEFHSLTRREQLFRIRPHLQSIIKEEYAPSQWRIDSFFSRKGNGPGDEAQTGDVSQDEIHNVILPELRRWALRPHSSVAMPTGSERYEALSSTSRIKFLTSVLIPEAILRICILSQDLMQLYMSGAEDEGEADESDSASSVKPNELGEKEEYPDEEHRLYALARRRLSELMSSSESWEIPSLQIADAFSIARKLQGKPPAVSAEEQERLDFDAKIASGEWKLGSSGRLVKVKAKGAKKRKA